MLKLRCNPTGSPRQRRTSDGGTIAKLSCLRNPYFRSCCCMAAVRASRTMHGVLLSALLQDAGLREAPAVLATGLDMTARRCRARTARLTPCWL